MSVEEYEKRFTKQAKMAEQLAERQKRLSHLASDKPKRTKPVDRVINAPKYRNQKVEVDGIKFDSKKEAKRWQELKLLEAAGEIANLQRQVRYTLLPSQERDTGKKERAVEYVADFSYLAPKSRLGYLHVEDVKGMRTPLYILKRKLMLWVHGITIKEI
jgi:hypothetical protein